MFWVTWMRDMLADRKCTGLRAVVMRKEHDSLVVH